jgi:adenosylhomocysteine nucleosidase
MWPPSLHKGLHMHEIGRIGLVAVHRESLPLRSALRAEQRQRWGEAILHVGWLAGRSVALAEVLPGPVNAALGAQALIVCCGVGGLVSLGSAGALDPTLSPGDLVVARRAVSHDAGLFLGQRFEPAGVMGRDRRGRVGHRRAFVADPGLVASAMEAAHLLGLAARAGTVVSGNQVICSTARKRWLRQTFDALAVDMEVAAVAQVAVAHELPWVGVRAVSDAADDDLILDFGRLHLVLDDDRPAWRQHVARAFYLLTRPATHRRVRRLQRGLALASEQAALLVEAMLRA